MDDAPRPVKVTVLLIYCPFRHSVEVNAHGQGAMKRRPILVTAGFLLVAFGLGITVGSRFCSRPVVYREVPAPVRPDDSAEASPAGAPGPCVDARNAASLEGKSGCVTGLVRRVYAARSGNTFLDFCDDYRTCPFSSVVFATDKNKFGDLQSLQGRRIELRGDVVNYQGRAEIIIHDPHQVRSTR